MNNKKLIWVITFLLIMQISYAQDFTLISNELTKTVCPSNTALFTATVQGSGNFNINYDGSAKAFATVVPQGFTLNNEPRTIYIYVTPKLSTSPGNYKLNLIVTSSVSKTLTYDINVQNCNQVSITGQQSKELCACNSETYQYEIANSGNYQETYNVEVTGEGAQFVKLSGDKFTLSSKGSKSLFAYYNAPCGSKGNYEFNLNVRSLSSNAVASFNSKAKVNSCFDFNLINNKNFLNMCEHTIEKIPLTIQNSANSDNEFSLLITGPGWSNLEKENVALKANEKQDVNLILNPDYGVQGSFDINLKVKSKDGKVTKDQVTKVDVRKCNDVAVDINKTEDNICNIASKQYNVKIKNTGEFDKDFKLETNYPWATLDKQSVRVKANSEENVNLIINSNKVLQGLFEVKVKATALDTSKVSNEDSIRINLLDINSCYNPVIKAEGITLKPDTTATVEVKVTNNGPEKASYLLSLSGKAASFVQLNPANLDVNSGDTEITYLYIAPPFNSNLGSYDLTITARVKGSDILDSKKVEITLSEIGGVGKEKSALDSGNASQVQKINLYERILSWLKRNLAAEKVQEASINISDNNIISENLKFTFKEQEHSIKIKEVSNKSVILEISSNPRYMILDLNETEKFDIDEDGYYDLELTLESIKDNKPIIRTKSIDEKVPGTITKPSQEDKQTNNYGSLALSFLVMYKFYIILGIIILIILILVFSYWKEIVDFFEEEPREIKKKK